MTSVSSDIRRWADTYLDGVASGNRVQDLDAAPCGAVVAAALRSNRPIRDLPSLDDTRLLFRAALAHHNVSTDALDQVAHEGPVCDPRILAVLVTHPNATSVTILSAAFTAYEQTSSGRSSRLFPSSVTRFASDAPEHLAKITQALGSAGSAGRLAAALAPAVRYWSDYIELSGQVLAAGTAATDIAATLLGDLPGHGQGRAAIADVTRLCTAALRLAG